MKKVYVVRVLDTETDTLEWVEVHNNYESLEEAVNLIEYEGDLVAVVDTVEVNKCQVG